MSGLYFKITVIVRAGMGKFKEIKSWVVGL